MNNEQLEDHFENVDTSFTLFRKRFKNTEIHIVPIAGEEIVGICGVDLEDETWVECLDVPSACPECISVYKEMLSIRSDER